MNTISKFDVEKISVVYATRAIDENSANVIIEMADGSVVKDVWLTLDRLIELEPSLFTLGGLRAAVQNGSLLSTQGVINRKARTLVSLEVAKRHFSSATKASNITVWTVKGLNAQEMQEVCNFINDNFGKDVVVTNRYNRQISVVDLMGVSETG